MFLEFKIDNLDVFLHADGECGSPIELLNKFNDFMKELSYFEYVRMSVETIDADDEPFLFELGNADQEPVTPISDEV
jgi:hypothetical protein